MGICCVRSTVAPPRSRLPRSRLPRSRLPRSRFVSTGNRAPYVEDMHHFRQISRRSTGENSCSKPSGCVGNVISSQDIGQRGNRSAYVCLGIKRKHSPILSAKRAIPLCVSHLLKESVWSMGLFCPAAGPIIQWDAHRFHIASGV